MHELLLRLVRRLVTRPDEVAIRQEEWDGATLFEVSVAAQDRGRVIGRGGRIVAALETLLDAIAEREGGECRVEVLD